MEGQSIQIRTLGQADLPKLQVLQARYREWYPVATPGSLRICLTHDLEDFSKAFCVFDAKSELVGYASVNSRLVQDGPQEIPHRFWAEIIVDPTIPNRMDVNETLYMRLVECALDQVRSSQPRSAYITFQNFPCEIESVNFLFNHGFVHTESVFTLVRDLTQPIPTVLQPPGMSIRSCKMMSEAEQNTYLKARNLAFPEAMITLRDWQRFIKSPLWDSGICLAALDYEELAGSITLFWDEAENQRSGRQMGSTEYLFVLPRWRGIGLGSYLVSQGLHHLKKHGLLEAKLEVTAANPGALGLYTRLGYQVENESWFLVNTL